MKFLCTADWHLRFKKPKMRKDKNYFETQFGKVIQVLNIAKENKCEAILHGGDVFDSAITPHFVVQTYISLFKKYCIPIFSVRGQHDLRYHSSNVENTPLAVLEAAGVVKIIEKEPFVFHGINIYGASFNEDIPEPIKKDNFNILLIHRMIVRDKLWEKQEDYVYGKSLLRSNQGYSVIISGDNHEKFVVKDEDKYLINSGSLIRSRVDQKEHGPAVFILDTVSKEVIEYKLKIKKSSKILDFFLHRSEKKRNKDLEMFITTLKDRKDMGLSFSKNLEKSFNNPAIPLKTKDILNGWLELYYSKKSIKELKNG